MSESETQSAPESPNARMRRQAAQRAQRRANAQPSQGNTTTNTDVTAGWQIDPALLAQGALPSSQTNSTPDDSSSRRRRRSTSPEPYRDLTSHANRLLSNPNKRLKTGTSADLLHFARARPDERMLLMYHALLQGQDRTQDLTAKHWTMPKDLKDNIATYTYAVLMSPLITTYRQSLIPTVTNLLKRGGLLPESLAQASLKLVRKTISNAATNFRSTIKKKLVLSVQKKWHITKLAHQLLAKEPDLKVTSALLTRLAFIRFQLVNAPSEHAKGEGFWPFVSEKLEEMTSSAPSGEELAEIQKSYLESDEAEYTCDPKKKSALASPKQLSDFQNRINKSAAALEVTQAGEEEEIGEAGDDDAGEDEDEVQDF